MTQVMEKSRLEEAVAQAHAENKALPGGANASYIPYLASVPSDLFGVAAVTTGGEVFTAGDAKFEFAIESISKVFTMALAMEQVYSSSCRSPSSRPSWRRDGPRRAACSVGSARPLAGGWRSRS